MSVELRGSEIAYSATVFSDRNPGNIFRSRRCQIRGVAELGYDKFIVRAPKNNTSKNAELMQCPECQSTHVNKNGQKKGKQNYICVGCGRQFIDCYQPHKGYSEEVKRECLKMYVNGMGFRAIERVKGVYHTTRINLVKQVGKLLPSAYAPEIIPEVGELDELQTFVGSKNNKIWVWTAVDHFRPGILGWVVGDHTAKTFEPLWDVVSRWECYFYVTDLESLSNVYDRWRPDYLQNLHDKS